MDNIDLDALADIIFAADARCDALVVAQAILTAINLPAIIKRAKAEAYEDAARVCESHMATCLEDRDIQRRWPEIKARNSFYAQAIRQRAGEAV